MTGNSTIPLGIPFLFSYWFNIQNIISHIVTLQFPTLCPIFTWRSDGECVNLLPSFRCESSVQNAARRNPGELNHPSFLQPFLKGSRFKISLISFFVPLFMSKIFLSKYCPRPKMHALDEVQRAKDRGKTLTSPVPEIVLSVYSYYYTDNTDCIISINY